MSQSCNRATALSFAEFAQNLYMCTTKLTNVMHFHNFYMFSACFYTFYVTCQVFLCIFSRNNCQKLSLDWARKSTFRRSAKLVAIICLLLSSPLTLALALFWRRNHRSWTIVFVVISEGCQQVVKGGAVLCISL